MSISMKKIILVEGDDDKYFTSQLLNHLEKKDIMVESFGGKDKLTTHIDVLINREGFDDVTSIIIFRDSEDSAKNAIESVNYSLRTKNLITKNIEPFTITIQNNRKIGFGLFPGLDDNGKIIDNGTLEHLCLKIFKENKNNALIKNYLDDFQSKNGNFKRFHKNELHTLFSFTDKYVGLKIGQTAKVGGFDFKSSCLLPFIKMISEM